MSAVVVVLDAARTLIESIEQEIEKENAHLRAEVKRLAEENSRQCDTIHELEEHVRELQAMAERAHT